MSYYLFGSQALSLLICQTYSFQTMVIQKGTKMDSLKVMPLFAQSSNKFQGHCKPQTESQHKNPNLASILDSFQGSKAR